MAKYWLTVIVVYVVLFAIAMACNALGLISVDKPSKLSLIAVVISIIMFSLI